jgi:hypothetical protein
VYEVKDGSRTLQFSGKLLAESSSWRRGSTRWIEFALYRTENGSYVLSRIGVSLMYHGAACPLIDRYDLIEGMTENLAKDAFPCNICNPNKTLPIVFPEKYRYWAQVSDNPRPVINALYKYDFVGARYLTGVAIRLLEEASENDEKIDSVYRIETIP